jgi:hypothetical protein
MQEKRRERLGITRDLLWFHRMENKEYHKRTLKGRR